MALPSGDSWAYLEAILTEYGLPDLMDFARQSIVEGFSDVETLQRLRDQPSYKKRFAVIEERKALGLPAMSESEVVAYEKQATQLMRNAGMPSGFWDSPDDFKKLMVGDISLAEVDRRLSEGYVKARMAPQDVRDEWAARGFSEGELAAAFLDPDRTEAIIMEQVGSVMKAAQAQRAGYGRLTVEQADRLQKLGITDEAAATGFNELTRQRELFGALPGENRDNLTVDEQLDARFANDTDTQQRIEKTAAERAAVFQRGGGFTSGGIGQQR